MKKILFYQIRGEKRTQLKQICGALGIEILVVSPAEYGEPVGALAGFPGMRKRGKATVKAKYLGKTYTVQISCRAPLVGKIFKPDLSQITSIRIRISDGSNEHLCTEQEFQAITDLFSGKAWYYYVETPTEKKEKMSRVISMYDAAGNEEIRIEVDSKSDRIRVENDGPYKTPAGFTLPEFIKNIK